jgi:ribonuclease BN (tRNA processing enzyme)
MRFLATCGRSSCVLIAWLLACGSSRLDAARPCGSRGLAVQVLGSGGPDVSDARASSSYLVWTGGTAVVLVDAGGGSALRFGESGADVAHLKVVLLTHLHADHTSDLPALFLSAHFEARTLPLPVFGPPGAGPFPSTTEFLDDLFGKSHGAWRYLTALFDDAPSAPPPDETSGHAPADLFRSTFRLEPHDVTAGDTPVRVFETDGLTVDAVRVDHGVGSALAWRIEVGGKRIVFSGDTGGHGDSLQRLAENADIFIAHNATSRTSYPATIAILMTPSRIGEIAAAADVKRLVLSHRMQETLGKAHEAQTRDDIRAHFHGPLAFANDLDCFAVR